MADREPDRRAQQLVNLRSKTVPKMFLNYASDTGCPYHRILLPARYCGDAFAGYGWKLDVGEGMPDGYDVYAFHGLPNELAIREIAKLVRSGRKFVWGVDDDWNSIPDWNPAKPSETGMAMYELAKRLADVILVSTQALAYTFRDVAHKVVVAPNLLEVSRFPSIPYVVEDGVRRYNIQVKLPVRVVWSGGVTHRDDIELLVEPLCKLLEKHGADEVSVVFSGMAPPPELLKKYLHRGLYHQPPVPFAIYQSILNSINPSLYLAPLAEVPFNLSKSNIRVVEGWCLYSPVVATGYGEYSCVRTGEDGAVVENDPAQWFEAMDRMVRDHEVRTRMGINGRERAEAEYNWENPKCRRPWYEAFARILGTPVPEEE